MTYAGSLNTDLAGDETSPPRRYLVTAVSVDPRFPTSFSEPRTEEIDVVDNVLFHGCNGPWDVEDAYERFWNRLNDDWEYDFPVGKERIKVISVTPA